MYSMIDMYQIQPTSVTRSRRGISPTMKKYVQIPGLQILPGKNFSTASKPWRSEMMSKKETVPSSNLSTKINNALVYDLYVKLYRSSVKDPKYCT